MENNVIRYWRITSYTPFCGEECIDYYSGTDENAMHKFAEECAGENAMEWWDEECMDEDEYYAGCGYRFEEISCRTYREECNC